MDPTIGNSFAAPQPTRRHLQIQTLNPFNRLTNVLLGAVNGLVVGLVFEQARVEYLNRLQASFAREARDSSERGYYVDFFATYYTEPVVLIFCIFTFSVVAFLVHHFFMSRPRVLLILWGTMGFIALGAGFYMSTTPLDLISLVSIGVMLSVSYMVHRVWDANRRSLVVHWLTNGLTTFFSIAALLQVVGMFVNTSYWRELRNPVIWLSCLICVVLVNAAFGGLVQLIFNRFTKGDSER